MKITSVLQLKRWLRDTTEGQAVSVEIAEPLLEARCRECDFASKRHRVVVFVHPNYLMEAYAHPSVHVHFQPVLEAANELAAIEQAVDSLPRAYREVWNRCGRSTVAYCKPRTISEEVDRLLDLWFLDILKGREQ